MIFTVASPLKRPLLPKATLIIRSDFRSGVWKYGNVVLVHGQISEKVTCPDKILLVLFLFKHPKLQTQLLVHECQGGLFLKVLPLDQ